MKSSSWARSKVRLSCASQHAALPAMLLALVTLLFRLLRWVQRLVFAPKPITISTMVLSFFQDEHSNMAVVGEASFESGDP